MPPILGPAPPLGFFLGVSSLILTDCCLIPTEVLFFILTPACFYRFVFTTPGEVSQKLSPLLLNNSDVGQRVK